MANIETNNTDLARAEILWKSADALRGQIDAAEYKHVVLGLIFLGCHHQTVRPGDPGSEVFAEAGTGGLRRARRYTKYLLATQETSCA